MHGIIVLAMRKLHGVTLIRGIQDISALKSTALIFDKLYVDHIPDHLMDLMDLDDAGDYVNPSNRFEYRPVSKFLQAELEFLQSNAY
jgi:hypothetical protein